MARQLLLSIGHHEYGDNVDVSAAIKVIKKWLAGKSIPSGSLVIENGSGLSRLEKCRFGDEPDSESGLSFSCDA